MSILAALNPIAFYVFGLPIRFYAIFITSAMIISLIWSSLEAKRRGISTDLVLELFMWCIPLAIVGARVLYVLAHPSSYFPILDSTDFKELFRIDHGGITIIGALFGAILGAFIVSRYKKLNLLEILDFGLPFMLLGQALGRWGNYVNQEAFGKVVSSEFFQRFPLGVYIDYLGSWHYATFFYEMVLNLIGFTILFIISRKTNRRGLVTLSYLIWYGIVRGLMEFLREDATILFGVYLLQIVAFSIAGIGIIVAVLMVNDKISLGHSKHLLSDRVNIKEADYEVVRKELEKVEEEKSEKNS